MRFVYLLKAGNEYKVGVANNLKKRISTIQTSNAKKVELVCARRSINSTALEKSIHNQLKEYGGNGGREWFTLNPKQALSVAISLNKTPEAETADLIIEDLQLDLRKIINSYWDNIDSQMKRGGKLSKPAVAKQEKVKQSDTYSITGIQSDPIWDDAIQTIKDQGKASTSLLQRELRIGYGRAARIIAEMENAGLVGPIDGIKPRRVLI